jgi:hypothetical protein
MIIKWNHPILIVSPRNAGKTNMARFLILKEGLLGSQADIIIVFSNGAAYTQYEFLLGPKSPHRIFRQLEPDVIDQIFKINEGRIQQGKIPVKVLIVFDDSLSKTERYSKQVNRCFQFGRINQIVPLVLQQSISQVDTTWRSNTDYFITFKPRTLRDKTYVWENLMCEMAETKKEAFQILEKMKPYQALVVDYTSGETKCGFFTAPLVQT